MLYGLLKAIFRLALRNYFREVRVNNPTGIPKNKPLIVLPNHNSAFLDPIVVAAYTSRPFYFLARGESFNNPILSRIYELVHMIPIYRPEYTPEKVSENENIFRKCYDKLDRNGCLMIFPEGVCQMEARLMPLKTGAARIALGAAARTDFELEVLLLPLGINYTNSHSLQGKLFMNYGEPISTSQYKEAYMNDPVEAARLLTADIETRLSDLIVTVEDERDLELAVKVDEILRSVANHSAGTSQPVAEWYLSRKEITQVISRIRKGETATDLSGIERRIDAFYRNADGLSFRRRLLHPLGKHRGGDVSGGVLLLYFVLFAPLFLLGFAAHILPLKITGKFADLVVKRDDFRGSVLVLSGVLFFSLFLGLEVWLLHYLGVAPLFLWLYVLVFPLLGLIAFRYWIRLKRLLDVRHIWRHGKKGRKLFAELELERLSLISLFQSIYSELNPQSNT